MPETIYLAKAVRKVDWKRILFLFLGVVLFAAERIAVVVVLATVATLAFLLFPATLLLFLIVSPFVLVVWPSTGPPLLSGH